MDPVTRVRRTARRLVTPVVLVAVALALLLPFASFRFELPADDGNPATRFEVTFAGLAPAVGEFGVVELRYGFWLAAALLVVVGFANVATSVPGPARPEPAEAGVS